jgi:uncharacterized protein YbaA (DUF1428 family)
MNYVDGYVIAVPSANQEAYRVMAADMAIVFKKHGALSVVENWGDDVPEGKLTSFTMAVKREESESVRDEAWKLIMDEPIMKDNPTAKLFDGKRMIFGGFRTIVQV